jgi:alpha-glucosidase
MVFQFEHLALWDAEAKKELDIVELKDVLTRWQKGLENKGWNALFIENHDKARIVSTWGNDQEYWQESATAFGAMYFLMQGTPFIYQGQEIGMTNVQFDSIDDYDDVSAKNMYRLKRADGVPHQEIMEFIWASGRDNSRTPMQWSEEKNAGFTTGNPWLKVNPNYEKINVAHQLQDPHSILNFYKKLVQLKKSNEVFTYGTYELLLADDPQVYVYTRTLGKEKVLVIANLSVKPAEIELDEACNYDNLLLNNYHVESHPSSNTVSLKPYEARVYSL